MQKIFSNHQIETHTYISELNLDTYCMQYPHTMFFFGIFTIQKVYIQMLFMFGGLHVPIALNLLKYFLFTSYSTHTVPF